MSSENIDGLDFIKKSIKKRSALVFIPTILNKISKLFKKYNVDIVPSKSNNLKSFLGSTKNKIKYNNKSGIYSIDCNKT